MALYYLVVDGALPRMNTGKTTNYEHGIRVLRKFIKREGGAGAILTQHAPQLPAPTDAHVLYYCRRDPNGKVKVLKHLLPRQYANDET